MLEKMTNMERKSQQRIEELMKDHKAELKGAIVNDGSGISGGGYQGGSGYSGNSKREYKKPKLDYAEEKRARNRAKWEKRVKDKFDKPGKGWANKRE